MKKFLLYASAIASMMLAGSCQKEVLAPVSEGEASVKFSIALPEGLQTKAMSQAESTDIVYYEIWNSDWTRQLYPVEQAGVQSAYASAVVDGCKATIDLKLISDQTYNFIFWAQNEACGAYDVTELKNVGVNYDVIGAEGNQDKFDAFYAVEKIRVEGPINKTITLYRPFAQLNFGADEMTTTFGDIVVTDTKIQVSGLATVFNTLTGYGEQAVTEPVAFQAKGIATDEALVTGGKSYTWVAMDYMLMMDKQALVNVEASFGVFGMDEPVTHSLTNVPLKKNYRTNIVGDLFTTDAKLQIIVDPDFETPDHIIGDDWTHTGDFKYTVNAGAQAGTLKAILEHAHSEAVRAGLKDVVVTVELKGDVDWVTGASHGSTPLIAEGSPIVAVIINGNNKTFTATGAGVGPIRMANGGKLTFNKVKIVDQSVSYNEGAWELGYLEMGGNLELNDCQVVNAIMVSDNFAANGTSFNSHKDSEYAVWVDGGKASFTGSAFAGPRGLKIHEAYGSEVAEVLVDACTFDHISKKPGIAMGDLNAETTVIVKNSLFDRCQAGDQGLYMYETDTDVTTFTFIRENNIVISADEPVVQEDGSILVACAAALQKALDNAAEGTTTIKIAGDIVGNVIVKQTEGKNIVIDGKEYNYDGTIYIWGNARYEGAETLDIKNVNFKHAEGEIDFISSNSTTSAERYAHNVTIEGCTFEGGANAVAARFRQAYNIAFKDSEVIAGHSLAQLNGCSGVAIEGTTVKAGRGVSFGTSKDCTVSRSTFEADSYGLRADGTIKEGSLTLTNTSIKAEQPIIVRKMTGEYAVALNVVVLETEAAYQVVFTEGADDAEYVVPTGKFTLTGAEGICVYPVANADSFAAAVANEGLAVVDLEGTVESVGLGFEITRDVVLNMNGHEFNAGSTAQSTWYALEVKGDNYVEINEANFTRAGISAHAGAEVVFNSGKINHKPERTSRYIFCAQDNGTTITIKDGTFKNDRARNNFFWADGGAVINVEGGNFGGVASNNKVLLTNGGKVIISGGTFNFDPTVWVAEGCTVTKSGSTWTVSK